MIKGSFSELQKFEHNRIFMDGFQATSFKGNLI